MTNVEERRHKLEADITEFQRELMYAQLSEDDDRMGDVQDKLDDKRHELATLYGRANDEILPEE